MIKKIIEKKFKASAILATFLVMMIILTIALSLALVTIKDMKGSIGSSKSNLAYQASDEGIEDVMYAILKNGYDKVNEIMPAMCDGSDGLIKSNNYIVELLDDATPNARIDCDTDSDILEVKNIKSIGTSQDNVQKSERAIVVPVSCPIAYTIDAGDDDTVGLWHFDEITGTDAFIKDTSENHNDGTPTGTAVTRGICTARSFDRTNNDIITILDTNDSLKLGANQTVEAWVNWDGGGSNWQRIVGKGSEPNRNYGLWLLPNSRLLFQIYDGIGGTCNAEYAVNPASDVWYHMVGTYDGTTCKLYINGQMEASQDASLTPAQSSDPLIIGEMYINPNHYNFGGIVDEVLISKKAKDDAEVEADFCKGCDKVFPNPINCSTDCP